jgi:hypothetical protein
VAAPAPEARVSCAITAYRPIGAVTVRKGCWSDPGDDGETGRLTFRDAGLTLGNLIADKELALAIELRSVMAAPF